MMRALRIFNISLFAICLGYSLAYPVQDTWKSGYTYQRNDDWDKTAARSVAELTPNKLSRLGRLFGSYTNMLLAGQQNSGLNEVTNKDKEQEFSGFKDSVWPGDSAANIDPLIVNNGFTRLDSNRAKRQQAWYVQYGKRSQRNVHHSDPLQHEELQYTGLGPDNNHAVDKASLIPFAAVINSGQDTPIIRFGSLLPDKPIELNEFDDLDSDSTTNIEDNGNGDENIKVGKRGMSLQVSKTKRQQGWYTPYGKRKVSDDYPSVL